MTDDSDAAKMLLQTKYAMSMTIGDDTIVNNIPTRYAKASFIDSKKTDFAVLKVFIVLFTSFTSYKSFLKKEKI